MKWLILTTSVQSAKIAQEIINAKFPKSAIINADLTSGGLENIYAALPQITHCVIFADAEARSGDVNFILGFLSGKKMPVYSVGKNGLEAIVTH